MKKTIGLAVAFAVLSAICGYVYLSNVEARYRTMAEPMKVIIANKRIPQGTIIRPDMVSEISVPKEYAQPKVFRQAQDLTTSDGRNVYISLVSIEEGEQVLRTKVSNTNQNTGISNIIPDGHKALAIEFDSANLNTITPGSRIDIFSIIEYTDNNKRHHESVYIVAQNILVLAVGETYLGDTKKTSDENKSGMITISVTASEAKTVLLAGDKGTLKYIIRPAGDNDLDETKPLEMSDMIKDVSRTISQEERSQSDVQKEAMELINKYTSR